MSDLKIKSQWLTTLLERLGMKPKSDGVEREILKHEKTNSQTNGKTCRLLTIHRTAMRSRQL